MFIEFLNIRVSECCFLTFYLRKDGGSGNRHGTHYMETKEKISYTVVLTEIQIELHCMYNTSSSFVM